MINVPILKSPMNWLFVGFAVFLFTFLCNVFFTKDSN